MKKYIVSISFIFILLAGILILGSGKVFADWWHRPSVRPTQPSYKRRTPVLVPTEPTVIITSVPSEPTKIPDGIGGVPTTTPIVLSDTNGESSGNGGSSGAEEDPCASGKSYTGPFCGWSPDVEAVGSSTAISDSGSRIGGPVGPSVMGLSNTSGEDLAFSDIMLLTGVLCLLLYARSKFKTVKLL